MNSESRCEDLNAYIPGPVGKPGSYPKSPPPGTGKPPGPGAPPKSGWSGPTTLPLPGAKGEKGVGRPIGGKGSRSLLPMPGGSALYGGAYGACGEAVGAGLGLPRDGCALPLPLPATEDDEVGADAPCDSEGSSALTTRSNAANLRRSVVNCPFNP